MRTGKAKQPYCFEVNDGELFAFAGIWDRWKDPSGKTVETCAILTTTPNAVTATVHDRMPVILLVTGCPEAAVELVKAAFAALKVLREDRTSKTISSVGLTLST